MKKILSISVASIAFAACTTNPKFSSNQKNDFRTPADSQSSQLAINSASNAFGASIELSFNTFNGSKKSASTLWQSLERSIGAPQDIVIIAADSSATQSKIVFTSVQDSSKFVGEQFDNVILSSGKVLPALINDSKSAVRISVESFNDSKDFVVRLGDEIIGKLVDLKMDSKEFSKDSSRVVNKWLNNSGQVLDDSGAVIGKLIDGSLNVVEIIVEKSGRILTVSKEIGVGVIRDSSTSLKDSFDFSKDIVVDSKNFVTAKVKWSDQKSVMIFKISGKSFAVISGNIKDLWRSRVISLPESGQGG